MRSAGAIAWILVVVVGHQERLTHSDMVAAGGDGRHGPVDALRATGALP